MECTGNMPDVILGGAEDNLWISASRHLPKFLQECVAIHHRHVPIEKDSVRHLATADGQGLLSVLRFGDAEGQSLQDAASHLSDDGGIVDDEAMLHGVTLLNHA